MIFDGRATAREIADELSREVQSLDRPPTLGVCMVGDNPVSVRYVQLKKRIAKTIGIEVEVYHHPASITTEMLQSEAMTSLNSHDGYIVQLPLPPHIDTEKILEIIPPQKDVDMLSSQTMSDYYANKTTLLPPVVGVFAEILQRFAIPISQKKVVVVGYGKLVGKPAEHWFKKQHAMVSVVDYGDNLALAAEDADIIALGAGAPGILKSEMIKEGVVVLDAGTSESEGTLKGDADPACAQKAALFTPVPGGIGPMTVIMLFKNLLSLYKAHG